MKAARYFSGTRTQSIHSEHKFILVFLVVPRSFGSVWLFYDFAAPGDVIAALVGLYCARAVVAPGITRRRREAVVAAIFWLKCRAGWSEYVPRSQSRAGSSETQDRHAVGGA